MNTLINHQFRLAARPVGLPKPSDWNATEEKIGEPADGQLLVKIQYISLDPAMRGWMNDAKSYIPPVPSSRRCRCTSARWACPA
jgi:NADPH-dependent curcumin reductase CurA